MKKIMKLFVYVAAAAMALASCQKNEMDAPVKKNVHFTIKAGIETKTSIADNGDGTYSPSWEYDDQIGIFFTEPKEKVEKVDATFSNTKEDGPVASFEGKATVEGEGTFYAFYPQSAFNQHYGDETIRLDLSAAQKPTSTSFDPACDILVAKPCDYLADDETVVINDLYFARLMSVLKINLKGEFAQGEIVESLTFSVDGVDITGNAKVDYKNATITAWNNGNVDRNVVTASYAEDRYITIAEGNNAAYLVVAPTTIPDGTSLSFTLKTANYNISKTVSAPSDMTFTAGNLSVLNLTINEENCEAIVADTRIWVEGFDGETVNKTQTQPSESGVAGTGVTENLTYSYSAKNCNIRINSNGQNATNPFLYIDAANSSFTASKIKIANEDKLALSAMVKGDGLKLTVEYKESASSTWSSAGTITGTSSYAQGRVIFAVPTTATSLDIRLTGNGVMYVDDIVLESTDENVPVVTLESISISNQITEYTVGDAFVKPTVTATYSDETTQDVTELATFSECDMNTVGDKTVTVTYEGKSAEYNFTVKEKGASSETVEWVATSFADLKEGDQVVIVSTNGSKIYAMSNNNGTGSAPTAVAETYANDKLSNNPEETIVWYVGVDGDSRVFYTASDKSKWLYCTNTNNGVRVGTNTNKKFEFKSNYLYHTATSRYIGVYNGQDWRCYTSTTTNIGGQTFQFFVKQGGSSEGGGETPEPEQKYLTVSQSVFNVTADQTSVTFDVNANVGWGLEESEGVETQIVGVSDDELVMTVEVTFPANETAEPKTHTVTFIPEELDENVTVTINQAAKVEVDDSFEPGEYWIVANGKYAMPVTSNYDYLQVDDAGYKDNVFTFKKVENGYTIQQSDDKYLYMKGTYNNFNVSATAPTEGHIWTIAQNEDGSYKILNVLMSKYIQLDSQYGTYGSYDAVKGTMPNLVPADDAKDRPVFSVTSTSKSVACDVTEASFEIVSNQNWTVVPGAGVSVDVTSGSGNGTITMTFAENKSEENVNYTAIVKADGLEDIVLTVVQSGIPTGDVTETVVDLTWTLGTNAYDNTSSGNSQQTATINGVNYSNLLKLGTSSKSGSASIKLPAGTTKVTYSAVAWKGASCTLKFTVGGTAHTQKISANDGATGNPKYTITSTSADNYELVVSVDQETTMTVTTTSAVRAILWDLKAVVVN